MIDLISKLGQVCAIIGAQWGDEGKGKVTDIIAEQYDVIARACGGANAGHTIVVKDKQYVFHLIPSGALHEGKDIIIGSGMVLHLPTLIEEIKVIRNSGIDIIPRLHISSEAHILFNYHKNMDELFEEQRSKIKGKGIGTTKRGIGPAYMDKSARTGIRMESIHKNIKEELKDKAESLSALYGINVNVEEELHQIKEAEKILASTITDTVELIHNYLNNGKTILVEGAQGTHLDIDHGTYPYVTSSSTTVSGALQGLGLPPKSLSSSIGIAKSYCTRVGEGDFFTEAENSVVGDRLRERGGEYGATTGRPRRCGWLSIDDLRKSVLLNGLTHWNITKLDVLDDEDVIPVAVDKDDNGPIYNELPGWKSNTVGITSFDELPKNAQLFIKFIEEQTKVPVGFIGTGPRREEMIIKLTN